MRRELSHLVKIKILRNGTDTGNPSDTVGVCNYSNVVFNEESKRSSSGVLYEQSLTLTINHEEAAAFRPLIPEFNAIVVLDDCVETYTWGNIHIPVKVVITPKFEKYILEMTCKSVKPLVNS